MAQVLKVRIPIERVGVLIGPKGTVKERIEKACNVDLIVNGETGEVEISCKDTSGDPSSILKAQSIVSAIGRGFSPKKSFRLMDEEVMLDILNLRDIIGRSKADMARIKGRLIGKKGKTRKIIEETSGADVSIYGHTVALLGRLEELEAAREAVRMLIAGSQHATVYRFLGRKRQEIKREKLKLWEE
ncbi:KH domain-containing protein [Candidatus Hecatella orcuttiae]|uniref:KH domain-containing protein n=1 Tax=Candidatus Hecatella orcuttiae TaxID=1935119 RepID=UPI002867E7A6|nr:KH domain-containing protein [Candidatus Hecatella orcuttiae]